MIILLKQTSKQGILSEFKRDISLKIKRSIYYEDIAFKNVNHLNYVKFDKTEKRNR